MSPAEEVESGPEVPTRWGMWLSHHPPEHHDRCVRLGRHVVCRRCLALYPAAFVVLAAVLVAPARVGASGWWQPVWWLLPAPAVVDWLAEMTGRATYSRRRQVALTVLAAPALGSGLAVWVREPGSLRVAAPFAVWGVVCLVGWVVVQSRSLAGSDAGWEDRFERDEAARRARLAAMVGIDADQASTVTKSSSDSTAPTSDGSRSR